MLYVMEAMSTVFGQPDEMIAHPSDACTRDTQLTVSSVYLSWQVSARATPTG